MPPLLERWSDDEVGLFQAQVVAPTLAVLLVNLDQEDAGVHSGGGGEGGQAFDLSRLDGRTPHNDLYLSRGHALYLYGLLVQVEDLANGRSIISDQYADALTLDYYHIELEDHDVVIAEGAAAETFAGEDHYGFDNAEEYERLYGSTAGPKRNFAPVASYYGRRRELISRLRSAVAPIHDARQPLDRIRDHIASRAELRIAA
jgi:hypothetical protein